MVNISEKFRDFCERHGGEVVYWRTDHPSEYPNGYCRGVDLSTIDPSEVIGILNEIRKEIKEKKYTGIGIDVEGVNRKEGFGIYVMYKGRGEIQEKIELPRGMFEGEQTKRLAERILEEVGRKSDYVHIIGHG